MRRMTYILSNNQHTFFTYGFGCHTSYITGAITTCSADEAVWPRTCLSLNGLDLWSFLLSDIPAFSTTRILRPSSLTIWSCFSSELSLGWLGWTWLNHSHLLYTNPFFLLFFLLPSLKFVPISTTVQWAITIEFPLHQGIVCFNCARHGLEPEFLGVSWELHSQR